MRPLLDNPNEPINDLSYYDCLDGVTEKSKVNSTTTKNPFIHKLNLYLLVLIMNVLQVLGEAMTGIANYAKRNDHENFGDAVNDVSSAVCGLVEAAAQVVF